jgi:hypothetical protein
MKRSNVCSLGKLCRLTHLVCERSLTANEVDPEQQGVTASSKKQKGLS